ncbi:hypothetical protein J6590_106759, partial [Homalodisca vitripennis]
IHLAAIQYVEVWSENFEVQIRGNQFRRGHWHIEEVVQDWAKVGETSPPYLKPHLRKVKFSVFAGAPLCDLFPIR